MKEFIEDLAFVRKASKRKKEWTCPKADRIILNTEDVVSGGKY